MSSRSRILEILLVGLSGLWLDVADLRAQDEILSAEEFAVNGKLDEFATARYLILRDDIPASRFLRSSDGGQLDRKYVIKQMEKELYDLQGQLGNRPPPWNWQDIDAAHRAHLAVIGKGEKPDWQKIPGLTKATTVTLGKIPKNDEMSPILVEQIDQANAAKPHFDFGPIKLRQSYDQLTVGDVSDAKGATVGYANNRQVGGAGAWNSKGVLQYPFNFEFQVGARDSYLSPDGKVVYESRDGARGNSGSSLKLEAGPAIAWELNQVQGDSAKDIQSLEFSAPAIVRYNLPGGGPDIALLVLQTRPYYQTSFAGTYSIWGTESSVEFVGRLPIIDIFLGGYDPLPGNIHFLDYFRYQIRVIPKLDYSSTAEAGQYTTRQVGDDWLRLGLTTSFDLEIVTPVIGPLTTGVSYSFLGTVSGEGGYSSLFKAYSTLWFTPYTGLTLEYSKGSTPVSLEDIDLLTLGLELKY